MSNLKVIEEGRRAREIWAKRLGFHIRTLPLNPDGTRPEPKAEVVEVAETVEAEAETVEATEAKPEAAKTVEAKAETVKAKAETVKATAAKPEVKAAPTGARINPQLK